MISSSPDPHLPAGPSARRKRCGRLAPEMTDGVGDLLD
jgi:hypothetical protein